jgi:hypothetical protein
LGTEDVARLSPEEHIGYFRNYIMTVMQGFSSYIRTAGSEASIDMAADRTAYTETFFHVTPAKMDQFGSCSIKPSSFCWKTRREKVDANTSWLLLPIVKQ